jgi:hypothetical protein
MVHTPHITHELGCLFFIGGGVGVVGGGTMIGSGSVTIISVVFIDMIGSSSISTAMGISDI